MKARKILEYGGLVAGVVLIAFGVAAIWIGCAVVAFQMVTRALYLQANLLGALREGDYSIRGTGTQPGSAADLVMQEINALGDTLQRQRTEAVESTKLLQSVMGAIDVAVFAFDMNGHVVLANPAAARLIGQPERLARVEVPHLHLTGPQRVAEPRRDSLPVRRDGHAERVVAALVEVDGPVELRRLRLGFG